MLFSSNRLLVEVGLWGNVFRHSESAVDCSRSRTRFRIFDFDPCSRRSRAIRPTESHKQVFSYLSASGLGIKLIQNVLISDSGG